MMVPRAPPAVAPPSVLRPDWKTLARLASRRSNLTNRSRLGFKAQTKKPLWWFWELNYQTEAAGFDAQTRKLDATGFEAKSEKTIDLGFEAQPRNLCSSSPRARCRPHTASSDLLIARPSSIWSVRSSPVLYTKSPTPATIPVAARHAASATCTPRDKQTRFSKQNRDKGKTTKMSWIWIQTSTSQ
jgi:hypothetical protein